MGEKAGSDSKSDTWTVLRSNAANRVVVSRLGRGLLCFRCSANSCVVPLLAAVLRTSPSYKKRAAILASHKRVVLASIASYTGRNSTGECAMTLSTSLVAVCCSNASVRSRFHVLEFLE